MQDLHRLALALPGVTEEIEDDRPAYKVNGKLMCLHRRPRPDAVDAAGERLTDVLMFRVRDLEMKELLLSDDRGVYFTTPHFQGYAAVLVRIPDLGKMDDEELNDLLVDAWLLRAPKRVARAWLAEHSEDG